MRSSLGKAFVGTAVALTFSLGAVAVVGVTTAGSTPPTRSITVIDAAVTYPSTGLTIGQDIGWRPEIKVVTPVYAVAAGDTLTVISARECGTPAEWPSLYVKNQALIGANFNALKIGWSLAIACNPAITPPVPLPVPKPKPVATTHVISSTRRTAPAPRVSTAGYGSFEACVIRRESGGNPNVMNGSGHYGLFQFSRSTWIAYGGSAASFGHASAVEQEAVFANAMARGGESNWSPYDGCTV